MMTWRPYRVGDWESFSPFFLRQDLALSTQTMIDDTDVAWGIMGLVCYAPGTFEVFLSLRGGRATWPMYRAPHEEWNRIVVKPSVRTLIAFIDPTTPAGEALAAVGKLEFRAFFPAWWDGEPRVLMAREVG